MKEAVEKSLMPLCVSIILAYKTPLKWLVLSEKILLPLVKLLVLSPLPIYRKITLPCFFILAARACPKLEPYNSC